MIYTTTHSSTLSSLPDGPFPPTMMILSGDGLATITVVMMLGELVCKTKSLLLCGDYLFYFFPSGAQHMSDM